MASSKGDNVHYERQRLNIFLDHRVELVHYANSIVHDAGYAEDLVQEAYVRFNAVAPDHSLEKPVGYLYRIVRNLAIDGRRRLLREAGNIALEADVETVGASEEQPSPETIAVDRNELRIMLEALAELPERNRVALEMHRFDQVKLKDIAVHLGISVGLAHRLVVDGLEHCRARLCR
jgi:RNA polymerase sigma-70 factor (ECF subfamily)